VEVKDIPAAFPVEPIDNVSTRAARGRVQASSSPGVVALSSHSTPPVAGSHSRWLRGVAARRIRDRWKAPAAEGPPISGILSQERIDPGVEKVNTDLYQFISYV
jgi:hypothetical protein